MGTRVKGFAFDNYTLCNVNDTVPNYDRKIYPLGFNHSTGVVSVHDATSPHRETMIRFSGNGCYFSNVQIQIAKEGVLSDPEKVKPDQRFWIKSGEQAVISNERDGAHVSLIVSRGRNPASTHDRSRK